MKTYNIQEAKHQLLELINAAIAGEEIIIAVAGVPTVRLTPIVSDRPKRRFGLLKGMGTIADDFDAPLPDDILNDFEGKQ